jgi:hypothetical protein
LALLPSTDASVLDLVGSGQPIAAYLIENGCQVTGRSLRGDVGNGAESFPEQTWINVDMRHFRFDQQFDGILAWDSFSISLQMINVKCLHSFQRMQSGAALMFTSGPSHGE